MEKARFTELLDTSLYDFRQQLLAAYTGTADSASTSPLDESGRGSVRAVDSGQMSHEQAEAVVWAKAEAVDSSRERGISGCSSASSLTPSDERISVHELGEMLQAFSGYLPSRLSERVTAEEAVAIRHRLRVRLGAPSPRTLVTGKSLCEAVTALGLTTYTEEDMNVMLNLLSDFIGLTFENPPREDARYRKSDSKPDLDRFLYSWDARYGKAVWEWPLRSHDQSSFRQTATLELNPKSCYNAVPALPLMEIFLSQDTNFHKQIFGSKVLTQFRAMREILLASDTNRLVAELTFVRINDLAAPPEPVDPILYIEPFVAILILGNGIMVGLQTDPTFKDWPGWIYLELGFELCLVLEIALRMRLQGCFDYWCGSDQWWNYFDLLLAGTGVMDLIMQGVRQQKSDVTGTSLLRFCRLIRLARIVKVFRIRFMKDLRLMVKGLIAGIRTLGLAFILLFAVLYVIAGFATIAIGQDTRTKELNLDKYFHNIPAAMFTAFRCFNGECVNEKGLPINDLLAEALGWPFITGYIASYMLVAMGIFNVILAVYVDITMKAAKENDAVTAEQHTKESIRVARTTRELLKKFSGAFHVFADQGDFNRLDKLPSEILITQDGQQDKIAITKELFLLIIQDPGVQRLMDELELPPDRANLFEIIDANGNGTLQVSELLHGLLKIRGELNKSDVVATLLATKAVQDMVDDLKSGCEEQFATLRSELAQQNAELNRQLSKLAGVKVKHLRAKNIRVQDLSSLEVPLRPGDLPPDTEAEPLRS